MRSSRFLLALCVVAAGCGGTNTCKDGTVFLTIAYDAVSDAADAITITVTVGSTSQSMDETHDAPAPNDAVEIDFATGYPAGQPFTVSVVAKKQGVVIGSGQRSGTLSAGCTGIGVSVEGMGGGPDGGKSVDMTMNGAIDMTMMGNPDLTMSGGPDGAVADLATLPDLTPLPDLVTLPDLVPPGPMLSAIAPARAATAGGTSMTLTGANFGNGTTVTFDGIAATNVTVVNAGKITCTLPADLGAQGKKIAVVVTQQNGMVSRNDLFAYSSSTFTLAPRVGLPLGNSITCTIAVGDLDGDGHQDLVSTLTDINLLTVLKGDGTGKFAGHVDYATGNAPQQLAMGDLNGDGKDDVVVPAAADFSVEVHLSKGDGTLLAGVQFPLPSMTGTEGVVVADFDLDGKLDVAATQADLFAVLNGDGKGGLGVGAPYFVTPNAPWQSAVADLNGDGRLDLVTPIYNQGGFDVSINDPQKGFLPVVNYLVNNGGNERSVAAADFNGDGHIDVATAIFANAGQVEILLNRGDAKATLAAPVGYATGHYPAAIAVGDLDGDGNVDVVATNSADLTISVLLGKGDGSFQPQVTFAGPDTPVSVVIFDPNEDGKPDVAITSHDKMVDLYLNKSM